MNWSDECAAINEVQKLSQDQNVLAIRDIGLNGLAATAYKMLVFNPKLSATLSSPAAKQRMGISPNQQQFWFTPMDAAYIVIADSDFSYKPSDENLQFLDLGVVAEGDQFTFDDQVVLSKDLKNSFNHFLECEHV